MNTTLERFEQIEQERQQTYSDPGFQQWFKELNIGRLAQKTHTQAQDMMSLWTDRHGRQNSFKVVVAKLK